MTQQTIPDIKWDLLLRYRFIEIIAYWEGRLTANHLMDAFKIGRQQASKDINWYKRQYPDNLDYDLQIKGHVPTASFRPVFTQGNADEYLQILQANMDLSQHYSDAFLNPTNTEIMRPPIRGVSPEILRPVIQACREQRRLDIDYISLSTPEQPDGRLICPHTLVNNGFRWHVRAYCEKNQGYRDFVLSRIQGIPDVEDKALYFQDGDDEIAVLGSGWSGKEIVYFNDNPVSEDRNIKFTSNHEFTKNGKHYRVVYTVASMMTGEVHCKLYIDDNLVDEQQKAVLVKKGKSAWKAILIYFVVGMVFGYLGAKLALYFVA